MTRFPLAASRGVTRWLSVQGMLRTVTEVQKAQRRVKMQLLGWWQDWRNVQRDHREQLWLRSETLDVLHFCPASYNKGCTRYLCLLFCLGCSNQLSLCANGPACVLLNSLFTEMWWYFPHTMLLCVVFYHHLWRYIQLLWEPFASIIVLFLVQIEPNWKRM